MRLPMRLGRLPGLLRRRWARPVVRLLSRRLTRWDAHRVRAGRTALGSVVAGRAPVLLLTTTGRRTGQARTVPLLYHPESEGSLLVVAANGTADWDPDWLHNLAAHPDALVHVDGLDRPVRAEVLEGEARAAAFTDASSTLPSLERAQAASRRRIPVVRLQPR